MFLNTAIIVIICVLLFSHCRNTFKISYYETKLKNRGVDIDRVKYMPIYKLWLNHKGNHGN